MAKDVGQILVEAGVVSERDVQAAQLERMKHKRGLVEALIELKAASEEQIASALSVHMNLPFLRLAALSPDPRAVELMKDEVIKKHLLFPVNLEGNTVTIAMVDPMNHQAIRDVEFMTGKRVRRAVTTKTDVLDAAAQYYNFDASLEPMLENVVEELLIKAEGEEEKEAKTEAIDLVKESKKAPIVKMVNVIIHEGVKRKASDIHIEPGFNAVQVRNRIDGILQEVMQVPKWVQNEVCARIKILAGLDITERRLPQDGRLKVWLHNKQIDIRVSTVPTFYGEKVVMRLLDQSATFFSLEQLGMSDSVLNVVRTFMDKPQGMCLVTGPTGSGKTTTLYALIQKIKSPGINIITVENPIEYEIRGVNQIQINEKAGLTFSTALRSVLRQDPNVILVGEIRDLETAEIAFQGSMTGHLIFSTLHTNDAPSSVIRLLDLGVEPFLIGSSVTGIIAQRLVRVNCPDCKEPYDPAPQTLAVLEIDGRDTKFYRGKGCPTCNMTGYSGREGIFEVMRVTPQLRELIAQSAPESVIREAAITAGMRTLRQGAIEKLREGVTTPEEVLRVVQVESRPDIRCPRCNNPIQSEFSICPYCLEPLSKGCPSCGQQTKAEWAVCPFCREHLTAKKGPEETLTKVAQERKGQAMPPEPKAPKILVVDDEESIRKIVALSLKSLPFQVEIATAADGIEALRQVERDRPDVIILDVMMPNMDGFEVCRKLRENITTAFIPIMMLTARGETESRTKGYTVGTDDYVTKPFEVEDLKARVIRLLRRTYGV